MGFTPEEKQSLRRGTLVRDVLKQVFQEHEKRALSFAKHGQIEYVSKGHLVQIFQDENEDDDGRYNVYAVQVDDVDDEGFIYTSQREAREAAADRINGTWNIWREG